MNPTDDSNGVWIEATRTVLLADKQLAERAIAQLADDQLRVPLDQNTNSISVIMKHIAGNLRSRWTDFLTTDGEKPWRNRDDEFVDTFSDRQELLACWESGWQCLWDALDQLEPGDISRTVTIRGVPHTVPHAIQRAVSHCGYHVGQIVQYARHLAQDQWTTLTLPRKPPADHDA